METATEEAASEPQKQKKREHYHQKVAYKKKQTYLKAAIEEKTERLKFLSGMPTNIEQKIYEVATNEKSRKQKTRKNKKNQYGPLTKFEAEMVEFQEQLWMNSLKHF